MSALVNFAFTYNYSYNTTTTTSSVSLGTVLAIIGVVFVIALVLLIIPMWRIFQKAGKPGWAAIIPIYNNWVLFEIVGYPGWWAILSLVPIVNIFTVIMALIADFKLAKLFGKSDVFGVMLILFPWVCLPILGYGKATFQGRSAGTDQTPPPANPAANVAAPAIPQSATPTPEQPQDPTPPVSSPPQPPAGPIVS